MKQLLIFLVLITCTAQAEIYKSQNEKTGEWVYSDTPSPNSEQMKLPPLSTYTAPPLSPQRSAPPSGGGPAAPYESMVFVEPENDATVRDNSGLVNVSVELDPPLNIQRGHVIQFYLDGSPYGETVARSTITIKDILRGTHVLGAQVLSSGGGLLLRAEPATFHLRQESVNNPNRIKPQPKPKAK